MRELKHFDPTLIEHHPASEKLVDVLMQETNNQDPTFFRMLMSYFFSKVAATMRTTVEIHKGRPLPVNQYIINLAPSGAGKGKSKAFIEDKVAHLFFERFKEETLYIVSQTSMAKIANRKAIRNSSDPDSELEKVEAEFKLCGEWLSEFDSATPQGLKQFRHKLLLADAGALNFEIDEIGDNLTGNADALAKCLELYDRGSIKESLIKNTKENQRLSEVKGETPCNMLLFGTPSSLFDGSKREEEYYAMLEKGYARRCLFGLSSDVSMNTHMTVDEIIAMRNNPQAYQFVEDFAEQLMGLADPINFKRNLTFSEDVYRIFVEYEMYCIDRASKLTEFDNIRKAEIVHRPFKTAKLAAAYAFIDSSPTITESQLYSAIAVAEESGEQLNRLLTRDRPYVKLAKYLGVQRRAVTQVDISEDLPFYKGAAGAKADMMTMAIAWGYSNNVIIKKSYQEGIEFLRGETLELTDTDKLRVSYSTHMAYKYRSEEITWDQLQSLSQTDGFHWASHHVMDGHRCEEKCTEGFNLVVLDVDGGTTLAAAQELLKDYKCMFYTTKRHGQDGQDRFRVILPVKYTLKLDSHDFKEFMQAVYEWLPFEVDTATGQRAKKWETRKGNLIDNEGELLDPIAFIPRTTKNEERKQRLMDQQSLSNLERWFVNHTGVGNRSNNLIRFALLMVDGGKSLVEVEGLVLELNKKIQDPLPEAEVVNTIMVSAAKAYAKQAA